MFDCFHEYALSLALFMIRMFINGWIMVGAWTSTTTQ